MVQNKEKLFKPEDFDKNKSSGNGIGWKKPLGILTIVAALGGIYSLFDTDTQKNTDGVVAGGTNGGTQSSEDSPVEDDNQADKQSAEQEDRDLKQDDSQNEVEQQQVNDAEVQQNQRTPVTIREERSNAPLSGTLEEKAKRVIRGDFGNGQVRKDRLGADYAEIQGKVNEMYRNGKLNF